MSAFSQWTVLAIWHSFTYSAIYFLTWTYKYQFKEHRYKLKIGKLTYSKPSVEQRNTLDPSKRLSVSLIIYASWF